MGLLGSIDPTGANMARAGIKKLKKATGHGGSQSTAKKVNISRNPAKHKGSVGSGAMPVKPAKVARPVAMTNRSMARASAAGKAPAARRGY